MFLKAKLVVRRSLALLPHLSKKLAAVAMLVILILPPFEVRALAQNTNSGGGDARIADNSATGNDALVEALLRNQRETAAKISIPAAREFFKSDATEVHPHGDRISLRNLDLSHPPTEAELRRAGQLGSPLSPSSPADPAKIANAAKRRIQEEDNLLFGQAMQKWNEHAYTDAVKIFRQHRHKFADGPWAGEAELHLGCYSQFSGSWAEAKFSFEWILNHHRKGDDIYQKAKLRRAVLHFEQGELPAASQAFREMIETETDWGRKTYAQHWLHQLSLFKAHEVALRDCGAESVAYVLRQRGENEKADEAKMTLAPDPRGFSLGELEQFAAKAGLETATAAHFGFEDLDSVSYPFVAHYTDRHFVTVLRQDEEKRLWVYDPRLKRETALTREQFAEQWSGLGIVFGGLPEGGRLVSMEEQQENYGGCCGHPHQESDLGCNGEDGGGSCSSSGCKMPIWDINPVNMNLVMKDTPMWFNAAVGPDVFLTITYNSQDSLNQLRPFGNKWTFRYSTYAMESPAQGGAGSVLVVMPSGRRDVYQPNGSGGYISPVGIFNTLTKVAAYTYQVTIPDGTTYSYGVPPGMSGTSSLLLAITDRHGFALTMAYDISANLTTITDNQNRNWSFSYNSQGFVSRVDDPFGRSATFSYDSNGNLVGQTDMGGLAYGYTYDASVYLTSIIKPNGTTSFYIEPADGITNMAFGYPTYEYPPAGGVMWDSYRITVTDPLGQKEEYFYNGNLEYGWYRDKNQIQSTQPWAIAPKTRYDYGVVGGQGVVSKITYADGNYRQYSNYNANRQPQTYRDERGHNQYFTFNNKGMLLTRTDQRGNVTTFTYSANGVDPSTATDAVSNLVLQIFYDSHRNVTSFTDALSHTTTIAYNAADQPSSITDATGVVWTTNYDGAHLLTSVAQGANKWKTYTYDAYERMATMTDENGYLLSYTYDAFNRPVRTIYPDSTFTENQWGCCVIEAQTDRAGQTTTFVYDPLNQLSIVRDPLKRFSLFQYDAAGNRTSLIDGNRNRTRWLYDNRNRVSKKIFADNSSETYGYDGAGNKTTITDALGTIRTCTYDDANNFTGSSAAGMAAVGLTYDSLSRISQMTDGLGTTTFAYDAAGHLISMDGPWANDTVSLSYDALSRVTSRGVNGTADSVVIDSFGRVISATNPLGSFTYGYGTATSSHLISIALPNGQTNSFSYYGNAGDQRLQEILYQNASAQTISKFDYQYNVLGQITKWTQQTGSNGALAYEFNYDLASQLTGATLLKIADGSIQRSYGYGYDAAGNRASEAVDTTISQDTHNSLNQLVSRQGGTGILPIRGQTDKAASAVTVNGSAAVVNGHAFAGSTSVSPGTNTVTVVATDLSNNTTTKQYQITIGGSGGATLSYDLKGNLLSDGARSYEWDVLNRLTALNYTGTTPVQRTEFTYNGFGQRVKIVEKLGGSVTSEKHFIWIPGDAQPTEERDASNVVTRRFYPQGEQIGGNNYFFTRDHLGGIREATDGAGAVRARYDYDPYGRRTANLVTSNAVEVDFGFSGDYYHVPSKLCCTQYRFYSADLGRWMSRDPIGEVAGVNLYSYVLNRTTIDIDIFGLDDLNLFEPGSDDAKSADQTPRVPGAYSVGGHGNDHVIRDQRNGKKRLSPKELADIIRSDKNYDPTMPVILNACSTGKGDNSFAQRLADELKQNVIAPNEDIFTRFNIFSGKNVGLPNQVLKHGEYVIFAPRN